MRTRRDESSRMAPSRLRPAAPTLRARSWQFTGSLLLAALLIVGTVAAGSGAPSVEPSFAPVPTVRPSVRPVDLGADRVIVDIGLGVRPMPSRPVTPDVPAPVRWETVHPRDAGRRGTDVAGTASWYCGNGSPCTRGYPGGLYAAAGPALRTGDWRGRLVTVRVGERSVTVRLIDWCACPGGRVLDLYSTVWDRLGVPLSRGLMKVTVTW